jgi:hypothetical protein
MNHQFQSEKPLPLKSPGKESFLEKKEVLIIIIIGPFRSKALEFFTFGGKFGRFLMSRTY